MSRSAASTTAKAGPRGAVARIQLPEEKGNELLAVTLLAVGLFLGLSLVTYHAEDPSLLHHAAADSGTRNLVGPVGAQLAAVLFGFFGLTSLLLPVLLVASGVRRFKNGSAAKVIGRSIGNLVVLLFLPPLLQLLFGQIPWRSASLAAGGAFGRIQADALEGQFSFLGSLLILLSLVATGLVLAARTTLGDSLRTLGTRLGRPFQNLALAWARRRERRQKEKARERVVAKHVQRAREEKLLQAGPQTAEAAPRPPLRVLERKGEKDALVRRVRPEDDLDAFEDEVVPTRPAAAKETPAAKSKSGLQKAFAFSHEKTSDGLPPVNLLQMSQDGSKIDENELVRLGETIRSRCAEFGVQGTVAGISPGPVITVYEFQPAPGVKVSQIVNLQDDLALALRAESVRIDRMPGRSTLGIEVPNKERSLIRLGPLLSNEAFQKARSPLTIALGTTIGGEPYYADLATMPHLLVAGATGAGKSVGLQSMITSILYKATRDDVQFIFIDPKRIELGVYSDIPHLKTEVVVDPKKAANALGWAVAEMERRYRLLAEVHVRSIAYYNQAIRDPEVKKRLALTDSEAADDIQDSDLKKLPYYVIVIDELADLMMVASSEVETCIARLAQMARAVGIHLIVATQRPSVDVLTGTIKANFPCRIAFATATRHDSRTILDQVGSEKLLGKGDALFMPPGTSRITRLHGAFLSEQESAGLIRWLKKQGRPDIDPDVLKETPGGTKSRGGAGADSDEEDDPLFDEAARLVVAEGQASASFLQRRMRIGFSRAGRLIDLMERDGILGPPQGSKPREVLVPGDYFTEIDRVRME